MTNSESLISESDYEDIHRSGYLKPGDVLLTIVGSIGNTALFDVDEPVAFQRSVAVLRPTADLLPRFLLYQLASPFVQEQLQQAVKLSAQGGIYLSDLAQILIRVPAVDHQRAISSYLDRETGCLDALIRAKDRVLAILAEKRQAIITRAVTRGMNPKAPLRASGISWVGQVPAHWDIWKVGHFATVGNGSTPARDNASYWTDGSYPWLNSSVVNQEEVTAAEQFVTEAALTECHLPLVPAGSVLVGITGQGKTRGLATILVFEATINQHLAFITPRTDRADPRYLRSVLTAAYDFLRAMSQDMGGTKGAITCEQLCALRVPLPPVDEQRSIVNHIAAETAKLDSLRSATVLSIALLRERRAALIAAAVTGQIEIPAAKAI